MKILIFVALLFSSLLYSQDPKETDWVGYRAEGEEYYNPVDFFSSRHRDFPELEGVNSKRMKINGVMAEYLEKVGVPVLIGNQGEFGGFFDLYSPTITRSQFLNEVPIGPNKNGRVGNLYLMQHDLAHHFAGIPGIRYSDLQNPEETRKLIVEILLQKEVFATSISSAYYIPGYMEWREKPAYSELLEFRKYAQGYYSGLEPMTKSEHVDVLTHFIYGERKKYTAFLKRKLTPESLQRTKDLGVPRAIPDLSQFVGDKLDSKLMSMITTYIEPIHSLYRKIGHYNFVAYSEALADLMMTDWYVKWSEDFKIGIPLEELHKRTKDLIGQIRADKKLTNPPIGNIHHLRGWKENMLKSEISLLGRRINEVLQIADRAKSTEDLEKLYNNLVKTYDELLGGASFEKISKEYKSILNILEVQFPLEKYVSWSVRPAGASSDNFWRNPYGIVYRRGDDLKNANAPRLSPKFLQGQYYKRKFSKDRVGSIQRALYDNYERHLDNLKPSSRINKSTIKEKYLSSFTAFIEESLLPQFPYLNVDRNTKLGIENALNRLMVDWKKLSSADISIQENRNLVYPAVEETVEALYEFVRFYKRGKGNIFSRRSARKTLKKVIELQVLLTGGELTSNKSLAQRSYKYTSPPLPDYKAGEIADIVRDIKFKKSLPVRYSSMADWISTNEIIACDRYLK